MPNLRTLGILLYRNVCNPSFIRGAICTYIFVVVLLVSNGSVKFGGAFLFSYPWKSVRESKREFAVGGDFDIDSFLERIVRDARRSFVTPKPLVERSYGNDIYLTNYRDARDGDNMVEEETDVQEILEDVFDPNWRFDSLVPNWRKFDSVTPGRMRLIDSTDVQTARKHFKFDTINIMETDRNQVKLDNNNVRAIPNKIGIDSTMVRLDQNQMGLNNKNVTVEPKQFGLDSNNAKVTLKSHLMKLDPVSAVARYKELQWTEKPPGNCENSSSLNSANLKCRKRLPHILGIGMEKCGTGAMSFFLCGHPNIAHSGKKEVYYWNKHRNETLNYYKKFMPYSSKYQLTMEFTPSYITSRGLPEDIKDSGFPHMRFIVMLRNPIDRAISYYLHMQYFERLIKPRVYRPPDPSGETHPFLADTFKSTVLRPNGEVRDDTVIIEHGHYVDHLERWFTIFDRRQFLVIDEGVFSRDPVSILQEVERFLGITSFFDQSMVWYNKGRKLWCKSKPELRCMDKTKGRVHPDIDPETLDKLKRHYEPYNMRLEELLGRKMSWT